MDYTKEQSAIINETGRLVVVRALAGTGKTSTLLGYAKSKPHVRMLYIVLNKSVQKEAEKKFKATGVKPMTSHGLAFRYTGSKYQHKLAKGNLKPYEIDGDAIPVIVDKIKSKVGAASTIDSADTVLGTCHKMKGLEADNVLLDDDFIELCEFTEMLNKASPGEKTEQLRKANEELNILYVGVTRAKKVLQLNMDLFSYFANERERLAPRHRFFGGIEQGPHAMNGHKSD